MRCLWVAGLLLLVVLPAPAASSFLQRQSTELLLDGKPFRAVGVNKFDVLSQFERGGEDRAQAVAALDSIARAGFRVVRFGAVGFYPKDMALWPNEEYWRRFDDLVAAARARRLLLIPVLCWNTYLWPDMAGESVRDMLTDRDSRSRQYAELYLTQVVGRYKDEPTILFWELWSELNLGADLEFMRPYGWSDLNAVELGAAPARVRRDNYTTEQMIPFLRGLAALVRGIDRNHLISSGHSSPRPAAQHLRLAIGKGDWTEDTPAQAETYLRDTHPDPIDLLSIHFYPGVDNQRFGVKDKQSAAALPELKRIADRVGKPVYIGETGGLVAPGETVPAFTRDMLDRAVQVGFPLVLYWFGKADEPLAFDLAKDAAVVKLLREADSRMAAPKR